MHIQENELKKIQSILRRKTSFQSKIAILYSKQVKFIDPTQEKQGLDAFIKAKDGLIKRCDDNIYLESH